MDLRYPIGPYCPPSTIRRAEREAWIAELEALPGNMRNAVEGLRGDQLEKPYRPGGWTVRQVVHHIADGHLNSYTRFRLALTGQHFIVSRSRGNGFLTGSMFSTGRRNNATTGIR